MQPHKHLGSSRAVVSSSSCSRDKWIENIGFDFESIWNFHRINIHQFEKKNSKNSSLIHIRMRDPYHSQIPRIYVLLRCLSSVIRRTLIHSPRKTRSNTGIRLVIGNCWTRKRRRGGRNEICGRSILFNCAV